MIRKRKASDGTLRYTPEVWDPLRGRRVGAKELLGEPGTFTLLKDARRMERRMEDAIEDRVETTDTTLTVSGWVLKWLEEYPRPKESSRRKYREHLQPLTEGKYRHLPLKQLTRTHAREIAAKHPDCARVAQTCWNEAITEAEILTFNPWVKLGRTTRQRTLALTEDEIVQLAACAHVLGPYGSVMGPLIMFAGYTGLRLGEVAGMRWDWVDGDTIWVRSQRDMYGATLAPKHRDVKDPPLPVALFPPAAEALRSIPRSLTKYVWTSTMGKPLNHAVFNGKFALVRDEFLSLPRDPARQVELAAKTNGRQHDLCFHTLRHSCASWMAARNYPSVEIQLQLRHKSAATALVYQHIADRAESRRGMVERFQPTPRPEENGGRAVAGE